jgi:hypothetical protein
MSRRPPNESRPVETSYAAPVTASRWRTATFVVSAVAAAELAALVAIGAAALGRSVARDVQDAAYAKAAAVAAAPDPVRPGPQQPALARTRTRVVVLNGSGVAGAAGAEADALRRRGYRIASVGNADAQSGTARTVVMYRRGYRGEAARLARDVHATIVTPLDGMRRSALLGAQVVLVVGR